MSILEANFVEVGGWKLWMLKKMGFLGFTFFNGTIWLRPNMDAETKHRVMVHEARHIFQINQDGRFKFAVKYLYYTIKYGYRNNPYEIDARKAANERID